MDRLVARTNDRGDTVVQCAPSYATVTDNLREHFPHYLETVATLIGTQARFLAHRRTFDSRLFSDRYPTLAEFFSPLHEAWKEVLFFAEKSTVVKGFCGDDDCLSALSVAVECCREVDVKVARALQAARDAFHPLYLLTDAALIATLSTSYATGDSLSALQPVLNFDSLVYEQCDGHAAVSGVRGRDGAIFFLDEAVPDRDSLPKLLEAVCTQMRATLRQAVAHAVRTSRTLRESALDSSSSRSLLLAGHLLLHHPAQVSEVLLRLRFTKTVEEAWAQGVSLTQVLRQEETVLRGFSDLMAPKGFGGSPELSPGKRTFGLSDGLRLDAGGSDQQTGRERRMAERLMCIHMEHCDRSHPDSPVPAPHPYPLPTLQHRSAVQKVSNAAPVF